MLRLTFVLLILCAQSAMAATEKSLSLVHYGIWTTIENGEPVNTNEFRIAYGDTSAQDALANSPARSVFGAFAMNAAFYFHRPDGKWNVFNFRLPNESMTDPKALEERQRYRDYLSRQDVREVLRQPYEKVDFGSPTDFIYKRMGLEASELPAPFHRASSRALDKVESIFQYNVDGSAKIFLRKPFDLDGAAQSVFQELEESLSQLAP